MPKAKKNQKTSHESPTSTNPVPAMGTLPPGWQWKRLGEIDVCAEITAGGAAPQGDLFFTGGKYPFVRVIDMAQVKGKKYLEKTRDKLNESGISKLRKFPKGTVLFTKSGASLLLNQRAIIESPMYVVSHIGCLIPGVSVVSDWLYWWMMQVDFAKYAHATTLPSLKLSTLSEIYIPLPPLDEQERIVAKIEELFSDLDRGVEALKTAREQLKVYRQSILQSAFSGKLTSTKESSEIPHESPTPTNPVPATGTLPPGWQWKRLGEIGEIVSGGTPSTRESNYWNGPINWITPADLSGYTQKYISHGAKSISALGLERSSAKLMPAGSVHFSSRAPIGYVVISKEPMSTNQGFKSLVPNSGVFNEYVYYYLKGAKGLAERMASGTTFKELSGKSFSMLPIPLPPLDEQERIVAKIESRFSACDKLEESINLALSQSATLRQSILARAFSGSF